MGYAMENKKNSITPGEYELLVMMSDQHSGATCHFAGDPVVRTPNLDQLAKDGVVFSNAYTPCPLCVPARSGFMTGRFPFSVGIGDNTQALASHEPTFAHSLSIGGYETTLIGRMHFMGNDQLHGFDKRIGKDICPIHPGMCFTGEPGLYTSYATANEKKIYTEDKCASLQYDRYVVDLAKRYLQEDHTQKQAMVVGTFMPHMPLGAPKEKVDYYRDKVMDTLVTSVNPFPCSYLRKRGTFVPGEEDVIRECRANYYAMIETEDELIGEVYQAFREYVDKKGKKGIFIYISDHGDHMGDKGRVQKRTLFDISTKIPMIIVGDDIMPQVVDTPVSLLDLTYTLCELGGGPVMPCAEGRSLLPVLRGESLEEIPIFSEVIGNGGGKNEIGYMVREGKYKLITYNGYENEDLMFDLSKDPNELENVTNTYPEVAKRLKELIAVHGQKENGMIEHMMEGIMGSPNDILLNQWGLLHPHANNHATWIF